MCFYKCVTKRFIQLLVNAVPQGYTVRLSFSQSNYLTHPVPTLTGVDRCIEIAKILA